MTFLTTLCLLVVAHAVADYPLQGDFLARAKNPMAPIPGVPWWQAMSAHAVIHAGAVGMVTGSVTLGVAELFAHWVTDYAKCRGLIGYNGDQAIHLLYKLVWAAVATGGFIP